MISKTIDIDGKQVEFRASAAIPRLYRFKFRRDIIQDISKLKAAYVKNQTEEKQFETIDLEMFENVAYIMAKHADQNVPNDIEEWLEGFNVFSIYEIMPTILELWCLNEETLVESKKKLAQAAAR
ncbi:MAG TPA: hypothetical protein VN549_08950 [Negativicutes bacterium]|nr:hypothetical protein [Negativicutes bacterium]